MANLADHSAVDGDDLAGDISRLVASKPRDRLGDVLGRAEALERDRVHIRLLDVVGKDIGHLRLNEAGRNSVAADVAASKLLRSRLGKRNDAALRRRVVRLARIAHNANDGGDVDDRAAELQ